MGWSSILARGGAKVATDVVTESAHAAARNLRRSCRPVEDSGSSSNKRKETARYVLAGSIGLFGILAYFRAVEVEKQKRSWYADTDKSMQGEYDEGVIREEARTRA